MVHGFGRVRADSPLVLHVLSESEASMASPFHFGPQADVVWTAVHRVSLDHSACRQARHWARPFVEGHLGPDEATGALVVLTELVSNALRHGRGGAGVSIAALDPHGLRIEVFDESAGDVARREPDVEGGRGLHLVDGLADRWGVRDTPYGKVVWAVVGTVQTVC